MKSALAMATVGMLAAAPFAQAASARPVEKFSAFAVDLGGPYGATTALVNIDIERWSTPEELENLKAVFTEGGEEALLDAVRDTRRVGSIRTTHTLGHDLRFAFQTALPDGSTPQIFTLEPSFLRSTRDTPVIVPPVPTPATKAARLPPTAPSVFAR